jgi:hypothetical protein
MPIRVLIVGLALGLSAAGCANQPDPPPFKPVADVLQLMEGPIAHGAEDYWGSVSTIVDKDGIHENFPRNDEEWEHVWAAGITIAESGNLLMMSPRAKDDGDWMKYSVELVDAGMAGARAAEEKNPDKVLEEGEKIYNVCTGCHMQYIPEDETE